MPAEEAQDLDLPEDLVLPLETGAPWWYWIGGRPALDLVNTLRERWRRQVETLVHTDDLTRWMLEAGVADHPLPVTRERLGEARALREAIDVAVVAVLAGRPVPRAAVREIDALLPYAGDRPKLTCGPEGVPLLAQRVSADTTKSALGLIALDAARMLADERERGRIRICEAHDCSARFYDRSPAGRRRWCSMRTCGNAAKARRHRARRRDEAPA